LKVPLITLKAPLYSIVAVVWGLGTQFSPEVGA
jgi:hypothetical protein